jgi:hypothetical protein
MTRMHVDGITHYARARDLACGIRVHDRSLDAVLRMYVEAAEREVDCMACIAEESGSGG